MSDRGLFSQARRLLQDDEIMSLLDVFQNAPEYLEEIKARAEGSDAEEARKVFDELTDEEQTEVVDGVITDIAVSFAQLRADPVEGVDQLVDHLRDPFTMEALLLTLENEEHIDEEYSEEIKEWWRWRARWLAVELLPEIYTEEEIEEVAEQFGLVREQYSEEGTNS